jgi:hypothetical protein
MSSICVQRSLFLWTIVRCYTYASSIYAKHFLNGTIRMIKHICKVYFCQSTNKYFPLTCNFSYYVISWTDIVRGVDCQGLVNFSRPLIFVWEKIKHGMGISWRIVLNVSWIHVKSISSADSTNMNYLLHLVSTIMKCVGAPNYQECNSHLRWLH